MLNGASPRHLHLLQNIALLLLTLFFLPLSTVVFFLTYIGRSFSSFNASRRWTRRRPSFRPKTVLVTGVNMNKGLALARTFHEAGHDVIGADFEPYGIPIPGRFSRSLRRFYRLPKPTERDGSTFYIDTLLRIIRREKVNLWVSCSGLFTAMEDAQAKEAIEQLSDCVAIQFDVATTSILHQKHIFIQRTQDLGLPIPKTHQVTSKNAVHEMLYGPAASKTKYIMKAVGIEDSFRADLTLLPLRTMSETDNHIAPFPISNSTPWVLQEYIQGKEYCTHALIINNVVKTFVACLSSDLVMRYEALPSHSSLSLAMQRFTQEFVARSEPGMTGHLSFDFMVQEDVSEKGVHLGLRVIECNPRAHTAVVLFAGRSHEVAEAYLSALPPHVDGNGRSDPHVLQRRSSSDASDDNQDLIVTPRENQPTVYWIGHEIVTLLFLPFVFGKFSPSTYLTNIATLMQRVLFWTDGMFAIWDPVPMWWLYQVYWPGVLVACAWTDRKWSRLNVSTGRILEC
jgi:catechol O-methyltransferase